MFSEFSFYNRNIGFKLNTYSIFQESGLTEIASAIDKHSLLRNNNLILNTTLCHQASEDTFITKKSEGERSWIWFYQY